MVSFVASQVQLLAAAGVVADIVGAVILSRALVFSRPVDLLRQQQSRYCGNPDLLKGLSEQRYDAQCGGLILIAGFALQLAANLGIQVSNIGFTTLLFAIAAVVTIYLLLRGKSVRRIYMVAVDYEVEKSDRDALKELYPGN